MRLYIHCLSRLDFYYAITNKVQARDVEENLKMLKLKGVNKKTLTFFKLILLSFYACYNNDLHLILTTTKIAIQNDKILFDLWTIMCLSYQ